MSACVKNRNKKRTAQGRSFFACVKAYAAGEALALALAEEAAEAEALAAVLAEALALGLAEALVDALGLVEALGEAEEAVSPPEQATREPATTISAQTPSKIFAFM